MRKRLEGSGDGELMFSLIILLVVGLGSCGWSAASCGARWDQSGLDTSWGPIQGCLVQVPDGRWVPSDNVRGVDLQAPK